MIVFKEIIYFMDKILLNAQSIFKLIQIEAAFGSVG